MRFTFFSKLGISIKISAGYALILLLVLISGIFSTIMISKSKHLDKMIMEVHLPLQNQLQIFNQLTLQSKRLTSSWIYNSNIPEKEELKRIHEKTAPELISELERLNAFVAIDTLNQFIATFKSQLENQQYIINSLTKRSDYNDEDKYFLAITLYDDEISPQLKKLGESIKALQIEQKETTDNLINDKYDQFGSASTLSMIMTIITLLFGILAAFFSVNSVSRPINQLVEIIEKIAKGSLPEIKIKAHDDEIGKMIQSMETLKSNLYRISHFAKEIGKGNLEAEYNALGKEDALGLALIDMRDNLFNTLEETNAIIRQAGQEGDLTAKVPTEGKKGVWKELAESINTLLQSIITPILVINDSINALASGDLTKECQIESKGELQNLTANLNNAIGNLNLLLTQITEASTSIEESSTEMLSSGDEMSHSSQEISSAISEMSHGAQTQVFKVEESSGVIEKIIHTSKTMAEKSEAINKAAQQGVDNSERGGNILAEVVVSINEVADLSQTANDSMKVLTERSAEIGRVLDVITGIAEQTNLLALNAAIEAAQAGDYGRGFAVVAEEIRKLAEDSRKSAKEIQSLLESVQSDTNVAVQVTENMSTNIHKSVKHSEDASIVFEEIAYASSETLRYSEEIMDATKEQDESISLVASITESIVVVAEQTAAGTEEVAASASQLTSGMGNYIEKSKQLNNIANQLISEANKFKLK